MTRVKEKIIFFDFDNTITACDVIDDMLLHFSRDGRWTDLEKKWREGQIGSKECLLGQISGVRLTKKVLDSYLSKIKIDPYFKRTIDFLDSINAKVIVLSDNFDYIIKHIFKNNGAGNLKIYSNRVKLVKDRLKPCFPFEDKKCRVCAHCKRNNLLANINRDSLVIYIGDGLSDACPAQYADIVFAKGDLLRRFRNKKLACIPYKTLKEVYAYFRRSLLWKKDKN